ncbi:MAG: ribonuclease P protein component [Candidatus Hydrogenedentota bacterium]
MILCRGAKNAVERNRIRRRIKAAVREVMKKKEQKDAVVVIEAGRDFLSMNWDAVKNRVMKQMNHVA